VGANRSRKRLPEARALYAEGVATGAIANALSISPGTVRRWAREDAAAGRPWTRDPLPPAAGSPAVRPLPDPQEPGSLSRRLCRRLEQRLERLVECHGDDIDSTRLEDHMLKICKVLDGLRAGADDTTAQLEAMRRFADFCLRSLPEEEMTPVRRAVRLFLEDLKRDNA